MRQTNFQNWRLSLANMCYNHQLEEWHLYLPVGTNCKQTLKHECPTGATGVVYCKVSNHTVWQYFKYLTVAMEGEWLF